MNGPQDLGGQMGFGPIAPEGNEPVFHADWEKRMLGLNLCTAAMGHWSIDTVRHFRESLSPADYYASSYYEIWLRGLEALLLKYGFVTAEEIGAGVPVPGGTLPKRVLQGADVAAVMAKGFAYDRQIEAPPRFAGGQRVRARNFHPQGHTRLPRYTRGKLGIVETVHGGFVFPDSNAHGNGEAPQRLYTVVFTAAELWGETADATSAVSIDAWESYLEPA